MPSEKSGWYVHRRNGCASMRFNILVALGYSIHHLQVESGLKTGFNSKRSDIIANINGKPEVLVECKAPEVASVKNIQSSVQL